MTKVQIPADLYQAVVKTLAERPYKEVWAILAALDNNATVIEDTEQARAATIMPDQRDGEENP